MEGTPDSRAEVLRIANLIGVDGEDIGFLARLSPEALYEFRMKLIDVYFEENPALQRFAKLAGVVPSAVIAKMTVDAIGPILAARIVGQVDTRTAVSVLKRVPIDFLCDTAVQTDPRRIKPMFKESPYEISCAIADELVRRKEYVAIGQLITYVEDAVMNHALGNANEVDILYSSFMVEDKVKLGHGVAMLSDDRITAIIHTAAAEGMWLEALDLMSHLEIDEFRRVVSQAMELDRETLTELLNFAHENDLWYIAIPAVCLANDPTNAVAAVLAGSPAAKKSLLAELSTGEYEDELAELLEKSDDAKLRKFLKPVLPD